MEQLPTEIQNQMMCSITHQPMTDPVVDREGNSYERTAILEWLNQGNRTSPVTRSYLDASHLTDNRNLRGLIQALQQQELSTSPVEEVNTQVVDIIPANDIEVLLLTDPQQETYHTKLMTQTGPKPPIDMIVALDISGSMGTNASQDSEDGLSLLDIAKHGVKTVIDILGPEDTFTLIVFNHQGQIKSPCQKMTDSNKRRVFTQIEGIRPNGRTNIWDAIRLSLDTVKTNNSHHSSIMILTDGVPNVSPPRGEIQELQKYKDIHPEVSYSINTFGLGYNLDSQLLDDIANEGNGSFTFIPDCQMLGTAMIHATSNAMSTQGRDAVLSIELREGINIQVRGNYSHSKTSWGVEIPIGNLYFEQPRDLIFDLKGIENTGDNKAIVSATLKYTDTYTGKQIVSLTDDCIVTENNSNSIVNLVRCILVEGIDNIIKESKKYLESRKRNYQSQYPSLIFEEIIQSTEIMIQSLSISKCSLEDKKQISNLLEDLQGQITESVAKQEWLERWGIHYLPSLRSAHKIQICNNFKDVGIQSYGGEMFNMLRDRADEIFNQRPPPTPSIRTYVSNPTPINMSAYNNSCGSCFTGKCEALMYDGKKKKLSEIVVGDLVMTPDKNYARVNYITKTEVKDSTNIVMIDSDQGTLESTPWHPVRINNKWEFPINVGKQIIMDVDYIYSFALDEKHIMIINGIECICLGHNFTEEVAKHPYFGTEKVISDLQKLSDHQGIIHLQKDSIMRDNNNLICGLKKFE